MLENLELAIMVRPVLEVQKADVRMIGWLENIPFSSCLSMSQNRKMCTISVSFKIRLLMANGFPRL